MTRLSVTSTGGTVPISPRCRARPRMRLEVARDEARGSARGDTRADRDCVPSRSAAPDGPLVAPLDRLGDVADERAEVCRRTSRCRCRPAAAAARDRGGDEFGLGGVAPVEGRRRDARPLDDSGHREPGVARALRERRAWHRGSPRRPPRCAAARAASGGRRVHDGCPGESSATSASVNVTGANPSMCASSAVTSPHRETSLFRNATVSQHDCLASMAAGCGTNVRALATIHTRVTGTTRSRLTVGPL